MTAMKAGSRSSSSTEKVPGIQHKCLRRKSRRTYELLNPKKPGESVCFDIGQIKEIVLMDERLREDDVVASVPAGFAEFAALFNEYATGPELFATFVFIDGHPVIFKDGSPIVWEHFLIDDSLVPSHFDSQSPPVAGPSISAPTVDRNASSESISLERAGNPQLQALSAHLKGASTTTDELTDFWIERGAIEHQYAARLAKLAERPIGQNEPSEFRSAIDGFRVETAKQAMMHNTLATQIAVELESRCLELQVNQRTHLRDVYEPAAKKLQAESVQDNSSPHAGISSEWKREYRNIRHSLDVRRLDAMRDGRNRQSLPFHLTSNHSVDDYDFAKGRPIHPPRPSPSRRKEWEDKWENLRDSCQEMEQGRSQFIKDVLSAYADVLSSIRAANHESYETIMHTIDLFRPEEVVEEFSQKFGDSKCDLGNSNNVRRLLPAAGLNEGAVPAPALATSSAYRPLPDPPADNLSLGDGSRDDRVRAMGDYVFARNADTSAPSHRPNTRKLSLSGPRPNPATSTSTLNSASISPPAYPNDPPARRRPHSVIGPAWVSRPASSDLNRHDRRDARPSLPKLSTNFPQRKNPV